MWSTADQYWDESATPLMLNTSFVAGELFALQLSGMQLNEELSNPASAARMKIIPENGDCQNQLPPLEFSGMACENRGGTMTYCSLAPAVATTFYHAWGNLRTTWVLLNVTMLERLDRSVWRRTCLAGARRA